MKFPKIFKKKISKHEEMLLEEYNKGNILKIENGTNISNIQKE